MSLITDTWNTRALLLIPNCDKTSLREQRPLHLSFFFLQIEHDCIKVIYICRGRDEKQAQNLLPQHQIPFRLLFPHARKRRKIYAVYEGKPRWLYMVIRWRIVHSWRMWLAGGFITLCKAFQTLMCNRAPLSLCCCSEPPFSSHYKHAAPAVEHLSSLLFNSPASSSSLSTFICHYDICGDWRVNTLAGHCFHA